MMFLTHLYIRIYASLLAFFKNREAASAIEYAIVAAMVAVVIIGFMGDISTGITNIFTDIKNGLK